LLSLLHAKKEFRVIITAAASETGFFTVGKK